MRRECLDLILIFSERQLHRVVRECVFYFNRGRPHQGLKQQIPEKSENENGERPTPNKIILFPGLKEKDSERLRDTSAKKEAQPSVSKGMIIAFPILNGLHYDYRRVA